jgi:hypothetical protein
MSLQYLGGFHASRDICGSVTPSPAATCTMPHGTFVVLLHPVQSPTCTMPHGTIVVLLHPVQSATCTMPHGTFVDLLHPVQSPTYSVRMRIIDMIKREWGTDERLNGTFPSDDVRLRDWVVLRSSSVEFMSRVPQTVEVRHSAQLCIGREMLDACRKLAGTPERSLQCGKSGHR